MTTNDSNPNHIQTADRKQALIFALTILRAVLNEQEKGKNISKWASNYIYDTVRDEAYALVTMTINLEDEDEGEYSLSSIEIEESKNPNDLNTLCNYVSGCTYEFGEGGDNEFRYNTFDPSKRVLEGTLEMSYDTKEGGTETHFFDMRPTLDISSVSTNEDGSTQEYYFGDIQFQPKDILDSLIAGGEKIAFGNANFTDNEGILKLQAF